MKKKKFSKACGRGDFFLFFPISFQPLFTYSSCPDMLILGGGAIWKMMLSNELLAKNCLLTKRGQEMGKASKIPLEIQKLSDRRSINTTYPPLFHPC